MWVQSAWNVSRTSPCPFVGCVHHVLPGGGGAAPGQTSHRWPLPLPERFCMWVAVRPSMSLARLRRSAAHPLKLLQVCGGVSPKAGPECAPTPSQGSAATFGAARSIWHAIVKGGGTADRLAQATCPPQSPAGPRPDWELRGDWNRMALVFVPLGLGCGAATARATSRPWL